MSLKLLATAVLTLGMLAQGAYSQNIITVAKSGGMFPTVQAAVNAAQPGYIIEILDNGVYEEQVTIDGRAESPWAGVVGGKNNITIRSRNPQSLDKPVIRYRDTQNTSPKTSAEAQVSGELPGQNGNFETNAAVRVIRAQGITIEGITIDGGSPFPFGALCVWGGGGSLCNPHFHGNAAVAIAMSGETVIRDCDLRNAYFGVYVKDRNTGGAYSNPNPNDLDYAIPLSNFGAVGQHLFEYNRVSNNSVGFYFESLWDLGSTVRYNLIYDNYHTAATQAAITATAADPSNQIDGAFLFKDAYLAPVAIYNNTLHNNAHHIIGNWQIGTQHLVFNNIFGVRRGTSGSLSTLPSFSYMDIFDRFPNRMNNNVFSAHASYISTQCISNFGGCNDGLTSENGCFITNVLVTPGFPEPASVMTNLNNCAAPGLITSYRMVLPGAQISGGGGSYSPAIPAAANLRWLQMAGGGPSAASLDNLYQSLDPAAPNFLHPDWNHPSVQEFIKNAGWAGIGVTNSDGAIADIGAISSTGRRHSVTARIKPVDATAIYGGTNAIANFYISANGEFSAPRIKSARLILPLPDGTGNWGTEAPVIPASAIHAITPPTNPLTANSANMIAFAVPVGALASSAEYGFFEIVIEGMDANGNTVTSDVGFLPYRQLSSVTLSYSAGTGGSIVGPALQTLEPGEDGETVIAVAAADYVFVRWSDGVTTAERQDKDVRRGIDVTAIFALENAVTLRYSAGAGGIILGTLEQVVDIGGKGEAVVAIPNDNYEFVSWSDGVTTAARIDSLVTEDITVAASFARNSVTLDYRVIGNGSISGETLQAVAIGGSGSAVTAVPDEGSVFVKWSDGVTTPERIDTDVTEDLTVTAEFEIGIYTLRYLLGEGGRLIIGNPTQSGINHGADGEAVYVMPEEGYTFAHWSDGVTDNPRTDLNVKGDITVTAYFEDPDGNVSVLESGREVSKIDQDAGTAAVVPVAQSPLSFTVGPNPIDRQSGSVNFYFSGPAVKSGSLTVYDANGRVVTRLTVGAPTVSWGLRDRRGRPVSEGTYLVKGTVRLVDGKREKVSVMVGVR